jgi:hypothetical protein
METVKIPLVKACGYYLALNNRKIEIGETVFWAVLLKDGEAVDIKFNYTRQDDGLGVQEIIAHRPIGDVMFLEGVDVLPNIELEQTDYYTKWDMEDFEAFADNFFREKYLYTKLTSNTAFFWWNLKRKELNPIAFRCDLIRDYKSIESQQYRFVDVNKTVYSPTIGGRMIEDRIVTSINSDNRVEWVGKYVFA